MSNPLEIYNNKKVFITGHTGFKGTWLSTWLLRLGAYVYGYSDKSSPYYMISKLDHHPHMMSYYRDIRDADSVQSCLEDVKPDIVFHLAAQSLVRTSYKDPITTYTTNTLGLVNLCEAIRNSPISVLISVATDKVYQEQTPVRPYKETDPLGGHDPYSTSKACAELILDSYYQSYFKDLGILCASVRAGNILGGGDFSKDRLLPDFVRAAQKRTTLVLRNPNHIRPWQYVLDALSGYLILGVYLLQGNSEYQGPWNFGPSESLYTTKQVIDLCTKYWNTSEESIVFGEQSTAPYETAVLQLDTSKAQTRLNWKQRFTLEKTIQETLRWYQILEDTHQVITLQQIEEYMELL